MSISLAYSEQTVEFMYFCQSQTTMHLVQIIKVLVTTNMACIELSHVGKWIVVSASVSRGRLLNMFRA